MLFAWRLGGLAVSRDQVQRHRAAHTHVAHAVEAEAGERAFDRLALHVENAGLEEDVDADLRRLRHQWTDPVSARPPWMTVGISFMMPKRRATSA